VDFNIARRVENIALYGLNDEEINQSGKYKNIALEIRRNVVEAQTAISSVKEHLLNADHDSSAMEYIHKLFDISAGSAEAHEIFNTLIEYIDKTQKTIEQYISDEFRKIWLVKSRDKNIYGETYLNDPLERIYINIQKTDAYAKRYKNIACRLFCTVESNNNDVKTIIHEASHVGAKTDDVFYMNKRTSLDKELERIASGDITNKEIKAIIASDEGLQNPFRLLSEREFAQELFNNKPYIRANLLIKNADSLTEMILALFNKVENISKRDTVSAKDINPELLHLFVSNALYGR
jgi:hypothetical protein